jgi:hypothetical protein
MASHVCHTGEVYQSKKEVMKLNKFLLATCFVSITAAASAQEKGYYSIGNNAEKLRIQDGNNSADSFFRVEKGYYAMETNRKKLRRSTGKDTVHQKRIPAVRKGYYSIGNNAARLEEANE